MDQQTLGTWTAGELVDERKRLEQALEFGGRFSLDTRRALENALAEVKVQEQERAERAARGDVGAAAPAPDRWDGITVRIPPRYLP